MSSKQHIGILTWHDPTNCGSSLQAYALHRYLRQLGFEARIINYIPRWCRGDYMLMPLKSLPFKGFVKRVIKSFLLPFYYYLPDKIKLGIKPFYPFYQKYCKMTPACTEESIADVCKPFSTIISGSDQVWNPNFIDPIFLQNFTSGTVNQISYAASLGGTTLPEMQKAMYQQYLHSFSAISVREEDGRSALRAIGFDSDIHIDPTLLINAAHYRSISKPVSRMKESFAFCYFLKTDRAYKSQIQDYIQRHHLKAIGFSFNKQDYSWMQEIQNMGPLEWLWLIDSADVVFTNSYHATILSLIFHTPFFTFVRFAKNDPICQNSRLEQLNQYFELSDYFVNETIPDIGVYPFEKFEERLPKLRSKANTYLKQNIK